MCDRITILVRAGRQRHMVCCEHGVTHLVWDHATLRLPTAQMVRLGRALNECATTARRLRIAATTDVSVIFDQYDACQVWLCGVGLCLNQEDFHAFCSMVDQACRHRVVQAQAVSAPLDAPVQTGQHLFSLN